MSSSPLPAFPPDGHFIEREIADEWDRVSAHRREVVTGWVVGVEVAVLDEHGRPTRRTKIYRLVAPGQSNTQSAAILGKVVRASEDQPAGH